MAATVVKNHVFNSFLGEPADGRQVMQVNTWGGHAVAAAVAVRNIEIQLEEKLAERAAELGAYLQDGLRTLFRHGTVGDVRGKGLLIGVELVTDRTSKTQLGNAEVQGVVDFSRKNGLIVGRAGGGRLYSNTITLCPPLVITRAECDRIVEVLDRALTDLADKTGR